MYVYGIPSFIDSSALLPKELLEDDILISILKELSLIDAIEVFDKFESVEDVRLRREANEPIYVCAICNVSYLESL